MHVVLALVAGIFLMSAGSNAAPPATDPRAINQFFDKAAPEGMKRLHVPGAAIAVVQGGKPIFLQGYGFANLETKQPVVADRTIFRIGSITKVFTATAAMQLVDDGRIDTTSDVNRWLRSVRVPDTYDKPITLHDLLTHTAGLDEINLGRKVFKSAELRPLDQFLKDRVVRRKPAGDTISYSTYSIALAGLVVQDVSGEPLREFYARHIFAPLGMARTHASFVPDSLQEDFAVGYSYDDGRWTAEPYEWFHSFPASDINGTVADMARFMIAHLDRGDQAGKLMTPATLARMHRQQFTNHPGLPGYAYGFNETWEQGYRGLEHGGSMSGYASNIYLLPEEGLGIFVLTNSESPFALEIVTQFLEKFYPRKPIAVPADGTNGLLLPLTNFVGEYQNDIYCHSCPEDERGWMPPGVEVSVKGDQLQAFGKTWRRIGPTLFERTDISGDARIAFRVDAHGRPTYLFTDIFSFEFLGPKEVRPKDRVRGNDRGR